MSHLKMKKKAPRRQKHVPQRTCVICREKTDKRDLIRIVNHAEEGIIIDPTGKKNGRGAYLCQKPACWNKMIQTPILDKALRAEISSEVKTHLLAQLGIAVGE